MYEFLLHELCIFSWLMYIQNNFVIFILFISPIGLIIFYSTIRQIILCSALYTSGYYLYSLYYSKEKINNFLLSRQPFFYPGGQILKKVINLSSLHIPRNVFFFHLVLANKMASCRIKNQFCISQKGISYVLLQQQLNVRIKCGQYNILCAVQEVYYTYD